MGGLLAAVLVVIADALRALGDGRVFALRQPRKPLVVELPILAAAAAVFIAAPLLMVYAFGITAQDFGTLLPIEAQCVADVLIVCLMIPVMTISKKNLLEDYGIEGRGWIAEMRFGALGFLASIPPVIAVMLVMLPFRTRENEHPFLKLLEGDSSGRAILEITLAAVVIAPLTEELIFRVILQGQLERMAGRWVAIFVPAVAFAAVHGHRDALPLFPLAVMLGLVFHIRRSYVAVVTLHALFNAANLILALAAREFAEHGG